MKRKHLMQASYLLILVTLLGSCQKEKFSENKDLIIENIQPVQTNQCRLASLSSNFGYSSSVSYNSAGLAQNWSMSLDYGAEVYAMTMQYDGNGRLSNAGYFYNGVKYYDIIYEYNSRDKVVKENWYIANTTILDDEVFFTYNMRGQAIRQQSLIYGVDAHMMPNAQGNEPRYDVYVDGELIQSGAYTFYMANKNPWAAMTGIPYGLNSYAFQFSKWWETSESIIFYDEDGNPYFAYDQDPALTTMTMNDQNYLTDVKHYDRLSGDLFNYSFEFENCPGSTANAKSIQSPLPVKENVNTSRSQLMKLKMLHGKELRNGLLKMRKEVVKMDRR